MKLLNKYEAIWILGSIIIMSVALWAHREDVNVKAFVSTTLEKFETKEEEVSISLTELNVDTEDKELEKALVDAHTTAGELVKLVIKDVKLGVIGKAVEKGDTVVVDYIGTTKEGERFDSSYDRGRPFIFTVGNGTVIQGWEQGLIGMKVGGQRVLVIPGDLAYGNRQVGIIPPNAPLIFAVELLEIR